MNPPSEERKDERNASAEATAESAQTRNDDYSRRPVEPSALQDSTECKGTQNDTLESSLITIEARQQFWPQLPYKDLAYLVLVKRPQRSITSLGTIVELVAMIRHGTARPWNSRSIRNSVVKGLADGKKFVREGKALYSAIWSPEQINALSQKLDRIAEGKEKNRQRHNSIVKNYLQETMVSPSTAKFLRLTGPWTSEYQSLQNLLDYLHRYKSDSLESANTHLYRLAGFSRTVGLDPDALVALGREKIEQLVKEHCDKIYDGCKARGSSVKTAITALAILKAFFACNGFNNENNLQLRLRSYHQPPRTMNRKEYVPTVDEVKKMAERAGSKRNRAIILTFLTIGPRITALRAMRIADIIDELKAGKTCIRVDITTEWNKRIPGACKNNIPYYGFIVEPAVQAIREMLDDRVESYGPCELDDPLFWMEWNQVPKERRPHTPISARQIEVLVKQAAKEAGVGNGTTDWKGVHPHAFRKTFNAVLRSTLSDGSRMDPADQEFYMGHLLPGSRDNYYDSTKVEAMRDLASKLVFGKSNGLASFNEKIAALFEVDYREVIRTETERMGRAPNDQEVFEILKQRVRHDSNPRRGSTEQKVIPSNELTKWLAAGWRFVPGGMLPTGESIIERESQS